MRDAAWPAGPASPGERISYIHQSETARDVPRRDKQEIKRERERTVPFRFGIKRAEGSTPAQDGEKLTPADRCADLCAGGQDPARKNGAGSLFDPTYERAHGSPTRVIHDCLDERRTSGDESQRRRSRGHTGNFVNRHSRFMFDILFDKEIKFG